MSLEYIYTLCHLHAMRTATHQRPKSQLSKRQWRYLCIDVLLLVACILRSFVSFQNRKSKMHRSQRWKRKHGSIVKCFQFIVEHFSKLFTQFVCDGYLDGDFNQKMMCQWNEMKTLQAWMANRLRINIANNKHEWCHFKFVFLFAFPKKKSVV